MASVCGLYIYPIKSLGGIALDQVELTDRGFRYDRRWMLVDGANRFLTQREHSEMALLQTSLVPTGIAVHKKLNPAERISIPGNIDQEAMEEVTIWGDICGAVEVGKLYNEWFSEALGMKCRLMYMPEAGERLVDPRHAITPHDLTNFSDAYPVLLLGKESLEDLNDRMEAALPMERFRPNIVTEGLQPYEEDQLRQFAINAVNFYGVKLCSRCVLTTIDQQTGKKAKEPLRTMATYRAINNNIYFGQNIIYSGGGTIRLGDSIQVIERMPAPDFELRQIKD